MSELIAVGFDDMADASRALGELYKQQDKDLIDLGSSLHDAAGDEADRWHGLRRAKQSEPSTCREGREERSRAW